MNILNIFFKSEYFPTLSSWDSFAGDMSLEDFG